MRYYESGSVRVQGNILVGFQCEKCGGYTALVHTLNSVKTYDTRASSSWSGEASCDRDGAEIAAKANLDFLKKALLATPGYQDYRMADFSCKCGKCGHAPIWAQLQDPPGLEIPFIISCLLSCGFMVSAFAYVFFESLPWAIAGVVSSVVGVSGMVILNGIKKKMNKKKELRVREELGALEKRYYPILASTAEELKTKMTSHETRYSKE